jgi:hypothetical protein
VDAGGDGRLDYVRPAFGPHAMTNVPIERVMSETFNPGIGARDRLGKK